MADSSCWLQCQADDVVFLFLIYDIISDMGILGISICTKNGANFEIRSVLKIKSKGIIKKSVKPWNSDGGHETRFYGFRSRLEVQRSRSRSRLLYRDYKTWKKKKMKKRHEKSTQLAVDSHIPSEKNDVFRVEKYLTRKILGLGLGF